MLMPLEGVASGLPKHERVEAKNRGRGEERERREEGVRGRAGRDQ